MFTPLYYAIIGLITTLLQLNWKRRIYTALFFLFLIFSPEIRQIATLDYDVFYFSISIIWLASAFLLESNKFRLFLIATGMAVSSPYISNKVLMVGSVEIIVFGLLWNTYLDKFIWEHKGDLNVRSIKPTKALEVACNYLPFRNRRSAISSERIFTGKDRRKNDSDKQLERIERKFERIP